MKKFSDFEFWVALFVVLAIPAAWLTVVTIVIYIILHFIRKLW